MTRIKCLSGNTLKLIAALSMVLDHVGLIFFPFSPIFRILGRLAFPIFAFMIAEGCRYTRNKTRYLLTVAGLGIIFQIVYFILFNSLYLCIFITFSFSIIIIYALGHFKRTVLSPTSSKSARISAFLLLLGVISAVFVIDLFMEMDYDFAGCMLPVLISLPHCEDSFPEPVKKFDTHYSALIMMTVGLIWLALVNKPIQFFSLLTIPLLMLYSGKRGKLKLKYFFYIFYPAHLVLLYMVDTILNNL